MLTDERQAADPHLLHLWEARRSLIKRWRRQKHNRTLKIRIARRTEEAADYAVDLMQQNWQQFCNSLQGTLGSAKTWSLLRHLLDFTKSNVIDEDMREVTTATVPTSFPLEAEEAAIALAITSTPSIISLSIITDSQAACRSFGNVPNPNAEQWEAALSSWDPDDQRNLV
ncbi:hypothetical protein HPB47_012881 [Ixodes persulcatus]|uniref:Uncharacterized protein n=1 Tax=Ixodes persulcatus TaxID=34615 RepID=A0AC60NSA7_IXOPE|nr:hypothetical protein HPB47_012881 [Ixodes persulcatus]